MDPEIKESELKMNAGDLYREEIFTDRRVGAIRQLVPVKSDGSPDSTRAIAFVGEAQVYTPMGVLPLSFEIDAATLDEAVSRYPAGVKEAVNQAVEQAKELRREAASSIVVPEMGPGGLGGPGGKIKLP
jgi:hypothetical protein